jgi:hypothetical protein
MYGWILILTLGYYGAAIDSISGFKTEADCRTAGAYWAAKQSFGLANYVCVQGPTK